MDAAQQLEIDVADLKTSLAFQGRKLGVFIVALDASDEVKDAWLALLPHMALDDLERILDIFETHYAHQKTAYIDEAFKESIEEIKQEYDEKEQALEKATVRKIEALTRSL